METLVTGHIPQFISIPSSTAHKREKRKKRDVNKKLIRLAASQNIVIQV